LIHDFADYNRDTLVNAIDFGLVRDNPANPGTALRWIGVPATTAPGGMAAQHDAALADLRWLAGLESSSERVTSNPARAAVDRLLATL
jgi:hypothetical protein